MEIINGAPHWVKYKGKKPVAKRKLTEAEAELVNEFMLAAIASAMRQGRQEGFSE